MQNSNKTNKEFEGIVGAENVITNAAEISLAEKTNYKTTERVQFIVRPGSVDEVSACVKLAAKLGVPIYPVSRGKNWGYGSRVPLKDNSVILQLDRLNAITDYNEELGYITVQAGTTFQDVYDFLRSKGSELLISTTGGSTDSSLIGNAIDRGIGTGLYAERFAYSCALEVVLPDGSLVKTGTARFGDNNISGKVYKWGMGPAIDGLFTQSNLGIVTGMTFWLMKCPEYFQLVFYKLQDEARLPKLIDALREMSMSGLVRPTITMYNDFRTLSTLMQYPFDTCTPGVTSFDEVLNVMRASSPMAKMISTWNGEISIRAVSKAHGDMQAGLIRDALKDLVDEVAIVELAKPEILEALQDHYKGKNQPLGADIVKSFLSRKYMGIPGNAAIKQPYFRKRKVYTEINDPDVDGCGMVWICPVVPFTGEHVSKALEIITSCVEKYSFEPAISLQCMSERAINIIASIVWDREVPGEDEQAEACYAEVNKLLNQAGYFAYRNTTKGMRSKTLAGTAHDPFSSFVNSIKQAVDPGNILAPERYNIG